MSPPLISKEDDFTGAALKEEVEKLHEERNMLLETIEDLKQTVEIVTGPELEVKVIKTNSSQVRRLACFVFVVFIFLFVCFVFMHVRRF